MRFKDYIKDRLITFVLVLLALVTAEIFLLSYKVDAFILIYIPVVVLLSFAVGSLAEYIKRKRFYDGLYKSLEELDRKYLVNELVSEPDFKEGELLCDVLAETGKSMQENVSESERREREYKDYLTMWVHEVKLPIASAKLDMESIDESALEAGEKARLTGALDDIERYVEQVLYYARSSAVEKDYIIKKTSLDSIVKAAVKEHKSLLIKSGIGIRMGKLDLEVLTDTKWVTFILGQLMSNSVKYKKEKDAYIEFDGEERKDSVLLYVRDNGIGIAKEDVGRVFEKGFTGNNGRNGMKKSTGMGLYICAGLCRKLSIGLDISSNEGEGTTVVLTFPRSSMFNLTEL